MNKKQIKILLAEDDELSQRMMGLLLTEEGFRYEIARDGIEAVNEVQAQEFDLVLMDLSMPNMTGFDATQNIRNWEKESNRRRLPIIALTAMLFDEEIKKCIDAGMDDCITKPFNTQILFQLIKKHVPDYLKTNHQNLKIMNLTEPKRKILDVETALPRFGKDFQRYQSFLSEFTQNLPGKVEHLNKLSKDENYEGLLDAVHNLKGVSASIGAMEISNFAHKIEECIQDGKLQLIEDYLKDIERIYDLVQEEIKSIFSELEK